MEHSINFNLDPDVLIKLREIGVVRFNKEGYSVDDLRLNNILRKMSEGEKGLVTIKGKKIDREYKSLIHLYECPNCKDKWVFYKSKFCSGCGSEIEWK